MSTTYADLQTTIQDTTANDGTEFVAAIPDFIDRAQRRLSRELDHPEMVAHLDSTLEAGDPFVTKPDNTLGIMNFYVTDGGTRIKLLLRTEEYIADYWPTRTSQGTPKYYANYGSDRWIIAPTPSSANPSEVAIIQQPATLSTANQTNFFTDKAFDLLFFACMIEAYLWMKNYSILEIWNYRYEQALAALQNEGKRTRRDSSEPVSPRGANTVKGD
jgi:hypothetical protein